MDQLTVRSLNVAGELHQLIARAAHQTCTRDKHGQVICKKENFFHRVGRWILTGVLIFFALILLLIICCCIKRKRSKKAKAAQNGYPMGQTAYANAPPPPPPPAHVQDSHPAYGAGNTPAAPVDHKPQVTGTTSTAGGGGEAASYYNPSRV